MPSESLPFLGRHWLGLAGLLLGCAVRAAGMEFDGFTEPYHDIEVAAAEMGLIAAIEVKEGDNVVSGQLLADRAP